jgi:hypothetical protein
MRQAYHLQTAFTQKIASSGLRGKGVIDEERMPNFGEEVFKMTAGRPRSRWKGKAKI